MFPTKLAIEIRIQIIRDFGGLLCEISPTPSLLILRSIYFLCIVHFQISQLQNIIKLMLLTQRQNIDAKIICFTHQIIET